MRLSRREFMKLAAGFGAAVLVDLSVVEKALAGHGDPRVIWLQGQSCSGDSVSLLNSVNLMTVDDFLLNKINMEYHATLIAAAGDVAFSEVIGTHPSLDELSSFSAEWLAEGDNLNFDLNGDRRVNFIDFSKLAAQGYVLVVEGAIPTGAEGRFCHVGGHMTMLEAFDKFSENATHILAVGTCACYGGVSGAAPNVTSALGAQAALDYLGRSKAVVNIPGCPAHPDWFVGTVSYLLANGAVPELDIHGRPTAYFGQILETNCIYDPDGPGKAQLLGQTGCLRRLGCKGWKIHSDCPLRKWNSPGTGEDGVNWCIGGRTPCHGCTDPVFPDGMTPFFNNV